MISYEVNVIFVSKKQYSCRKDMHTEIKSLRRDEVTGEWRRLHNEELNDL